MLHSLRSYAAAAFVVMATLASPRAQAEPLVGLFEGHGIAPPTDAARAREVAVAVQRLASQCLKTYVVPGGGMGFEAAECAGARQRVGRFGPDAASAILDALDDPRTYMPYRDKAFSSLLQTLGEIGRAEVVPVLITGLERLEARKALPDRRVADHGRIHEKVLHQVLANLTFVDDVLQTDWKGWSSWYERHGKEPRSVWRADSIALASAQLSNPNPCIAERAGVRLAGFPETRARAISALKMIARAPQSADCWGAREFLNRVEPGRGWIPEAKN